MLSPRAIITGLHIDYKKHCQLQFGSYVQVHNQHDNSLLPRTSGAIALHPTGNMQGTYYFLNLHSGKRIMRNRWTELPMPNEVIATVHQLAAACRKYKGIVFTDRNGNVIDDHNDPESDNLEIRGVGRHTGVITGVDRHTRIETYNTTGVTDDITAITEINGNNLPETNDNDTPNISTDMVTEVKDTYNNTDSTNMETDTHFEGFEDNNLLVKQESQDDIYTTVDDMKTIHEMNTAQLYLDPKAGENRRDSELPIEELPVRNLLQTHD